MYLDGVPAAADFAPTDNNNGGVDAGVTPLVLTVPMALPTADDDKQRMAIATQDGIPVEQVPTVRRDDTDLEIEWSLANGTMQEARAALAVNGANEFFRYDPAMAATGPMQDAPPALLGGRPIVVPAGGTVDGVFREDELAEAAQDLDAFSRAGYNPVKALLTRWPTKDVSGGTGGVLDHIPSNAVALLLRLEMVVVADQPLRLSATLRVRDRTGRLRATEMDASKLVAPSTTAYTLPPPMMMMKPTP